MLSINSWLLIVWSAILYGLCCFFCFLDEAMRFLFVPSYVQYSYYSVVDRGRTAAYICKNQLMIKLGRGAAEAQNNNWWCCLQRTDNLEGHFKSYLRSRETCVIVRSLLPTSRCWRLLPPPVLWSKTRNSVQTKTCFRVRDIARCLWLRLARRPSSMQ